MRLQEKWFTKKIEAWEREGKVSALQQETFQSAFNQDRLLLQQHS